MRRVLYIIVAALSILLPVSCQEESQGNIYGAGTLSIGDTSDQWTYISLREGAVMGTCPIADTVAQKEWAARSDWDLAIGKGYIRTNSGVSGVGSGGSCIVASPFDSLTSLRDLPCLPDSVFVEIW